MKEIIIIGAGPAGITTAIQLKRYGIPFALIEKERVGGLLWNANLVENYPGFPNGVTGAKLIALMQKQMERLDIPIVREEASDITWQDKQFVVVTQNKKRMADILVIATGTKAKPIPNIFSPDAKSKVFTEVWHLLNVEDKHIAIVGAGDAAFDYALNLAKRRNFVTILNRGREVKCLPLLWERVAAQPSIQYADGVAVRRANVSEDGSRLKVRCERDGDEVTLDVDYLLFAIGRIPQVDFLSESLRAQESALIESKKLFYIGDVKNELLRQVAIAAGDGLRAAMQIHITYKDEG